LVGLEVRAGSGDGVQQVPELGLREVFLVTSSSGDFLFEVSFETFKEDGELVEVSAEDLVLLAVVTVGLKKVGVSEGRGVSDSVDLLFEFLRRVQAEILLEDLFVSALFLVELDFAETLIVELSLVVVVGGDVLEVVVLLEA